MSPTRSESARLRPAFFVYTGLLNRAVPYRASTPVQSVPCRAVPSRHGTFQFVFTLTLQTVPCGAVPWSAGPLF